MSRLPPVLFAAILSPIAAAQTFTLSLDVLDPSDPGGPAPSGVIVVDLFADVPDGGLCAGGDPWVWGLLNATAHNGAALRYAPPSGDPPQFTSLVIPGTEHRYVTFCNQGLTRDGTARFTAQRHYIAGDAPIAAPNEVRIGWYSPVPETCAYSAQDMFVARVAIDTNDSTIREAAVFPPGAQPIGWRPLLLSSASGSGTQSGTYFGRSAQLNWGLYAIACPADLTGDNAVELGDLAVLLANFGQANADYFQGDFDSDSDVDLEDLSYLLAHFGGNCE